VSIDLIPIGLVSSARIILDHGAPTRTLNDIEFNAQE
jgi:hypothetical protein